MTEEGYERQIADGSRFEFGRNWAHFLETLDDEKIRAAEKSLCAMLEIDGLRGKTFLDVGSGSGLFSLAANRLGARVRSFDYDPQSVECTKTLKSRYFKNDDSWKVEQGSILDRSYLAKLGQFEIVYSWGVLHHTGDMWGAIENVISCVAPGGTLFIAIYNDQGWPSKYWKAVKRAYNAIPLLRPVLIVFHFPYLFGARFAARLLTGRLRVERGMNLWHDMLDWLGGLPFEVAKPERIHEFCLRRGLVLTRLITCGGRSGCNEFVFARKQT